MCSALPHASPVLGCSLLCGWLQLWPSASLEHLRAGLGVRPVIYSCSRGLREFLCKSCESCWWPVQTPGPPNLVIHQPWDPVGSQALQPDREVLVAWSMSYLTGLSPGQCSDS